MRTPLHDTIGYKIRKRLIAHVSYDTNLEHTIVKNSSGSTSGCCSYQIPGRHLVVVVVVVVVVIVVVVVAVVVV